MARLLDRLTHRGAMALKAPGMHADGNGLYLEVTTGGAKRWTLVFQFHGARKQMGLGSFGLVGLSEARDKATAARKLVREGINPIEARKAERAAVAGDTFGDAADALMATLEPSWRNAKHKTQWKTSLEVHAASLRPLAINEVGTEDVLDALKPIWTAIPETSSRTRGRIERVLDAAKAKGQRTGENPARWRGHLQLLLPKRKRLYQGHHPALPFAEVSDFIGQLRQREAMAARALEWTILTAARTSETLGATWAEIDLNAKVWSVPKERMKGVDPTEHRVPLSEAAVAILRAVRAQVVAAGLIYTKQWMAAGADAETGELGSNFLFPGDLKGGQLSTAAMKAVLRRMRIPAEKASVHGFRSTFKDWASECTSFPDTLSEEALAHRVGSEVRRAYRRGDALEKRRKLMQAWDGFCGKTLSENVIELRKNAHAKSVRTS